MGSKPVGLSASRGAAVLGLSEYQTPFTVWQRICEERRPGFNAERGYLLPEEPDNAAIRWGGAFEDAIIELAQAGRLGCQIRDREGFYSIDGAGTEGGEDRFITCHIDGRYDGGTLHEGKTTGLFNYWDNWGEPGSDRVPQIYQVQVQHQCLCTGAREAIVSVLVFPRRPEEWEAEDWRCELDAETGHWLLRNDRLPEIAEPITWARVLAEMGLFHQYPVAASPSLQRLLVDAYSDFWHRYVLPEREPDLASYEDVRRAFPQPVGTVVADEQLERWAREYREIGEEISPRGRLGKRREELKVLILKSMRSSDRAFDDESRERTVLRDRQGQKLVQWNGKIFR